MQKQQEISAELIDQGNLTPRESEIVLLLCQGFSDKSIARALEISVKTLAAHLDHVYTKLQVRQHSVNTRCATIATLIARGMVRVSSHTLCALLIFNMIGLDDQSIRRSARGRITRTTISQTSYRIH